MSDDFGTPGMVAVHKAAKISPSRPTEKILKMVVKVKPGMQTKRVNYLLLVILLLHEFREVASGHSARQFCDQKLPTYREGAMDNDPPFSHMPNHKGLNTILSKRAQDAPLGTPLQSRPLIGGVFQESLPGYDNPDFARFHHVLNAASHHNHPNLTVLVLGGSMSSGRMRDNWANIMESNCSLELLPSGNDPYSGPWYCFNPDGSGPKVTEGIDCKPCSFSARFEHWLKVAYPHKNVKVINGAVGGFGTSTFAGLVSGLKFKAEVDVVILNFVYNDEYLLRVSKVRAKKRIELDSLLLLENSGHVNPSLDMRGRKRTRLKKVGKWWVLLDKSHPTSTINQSPLLYKQQKDNYIHHLHDELIQQSNNSIDYEFRKHHEVLIRSLLAFPKKPAILNIELNSLPNPNELTTSNGFFQPHADVLQYYRIPSISWNQSMSAYPRFSAQGHPSWNTHQIIADWLSYAWIRMHEEVLCCSLDEHNRHCHKENKVIITPPFKWVDEQTSGFCFSPLSFFDASSLNPPAVQQNNHSLFGFHDESYYPNGKKIEEYQIPIVVQYDIGWHFGNDGPNNNKKAWWIDSIKGGTIVFPVSISHPSFSIGGIGHLTSWDPSMGAVRVSFMDDPKDRFLIINGSNAVEGSNIKVSISEYTPLCYPTHQNDDDDDDDLKQNKETFLLPSCPIKEQPNAGRSIESNLPVVWNDEPKTSKLHNLRIELIPRPKSTRNKFVIRYISTC